MKSFVALIILLIFANNNVLLLKAKLKKAEKLGLLSQVKTNLKMTSKDSPSTSPETVAKNTVKVDVEYKGWLIIESNQFTDPSIYKYVPELKDKTPPRLQITEKTELDAIAKSGHFRKNEKYQPGSVIVPSPNSFFFRLNNKMLYYSNLEDDIRIIDSFRLKYLSDITDSIFGDLCFKLTEKESNKYWNLCASTTAEKNRWICAIKKAIGQECKLSKEDLMDNVQVKKLKVEQPIIIIPIPSPMCNEKWTYINHGSDWECLCKEGKSQSPIDLPLNTEAVKIPNKAQFQFRSLSTDDEGKPLQIRLEDYKLSIDGNFGKMVSWELVTYQAKRIIFHTHGEHTINQIKHDLEVQILFDSITEGHIQKKAVLSVLYKKTPGAKNLFFDTDINILDLPDKGEKTRNLEKTINIEDLFKESEDDPFVAFSYFKYEGSMTSPPCEEQTTWYVAHPVLPLSSTTIDYFMDLFGSTPYQINQDCPTMNTGTKVVDPENFRNIQNRNGRVVYFYESPPCVQKYKNKLPKDDITGHFEKVEKRLTEYFFVPGTEPSGVAGAFHVSKNEAMSNGRFNNLKVNIPDERSFKR